MRRGSYLQVFVDFFVGGVFDFWWHEVGIFEVAVFGRAGGGEDAVLFP